MLYKLAQGISLGDKNGSVPTMGLYDEETWGFDLEKIVFRWAKHWPNKVPFYLKNRVAKPYKVQELEDYAVDGRITEWHKDLPARFKSLKHNLDPFYMVT
jgi:hypothetical protein